MRTRREGVLGDVAVVLGCFLLAGLVAGLVWPLLVSPVEVVRTEAGLSTAEVALSERFDNDAWFMVLAVALGAPLGLLMTAWRRADEIVTVVAVVVGASLASWMTGAIGRSVGPEDPAVALSDAPVGATAEGMVSVAAQGAYFVWPLAALAGALLVLWGGDREHPTGTTHPDERGAMFRSHEGNDHVQ